MVDEILEDFGYKIVVQDDFFAPAGGVLDDVDPLIGHDFEGVAGELDEGDVGYRLLITSHQREIQIREGVEELLRGKGDPSRLKAGFKVELRYGVEGSLF